MKNTIVDGAVDMGQLEQFAYGSYQLSLLRGQSRWSGADLRGKAASYGGSYAKSRASLVRRLIKFGYDVSEARVEHGLRQVTIRPGSAQ